MLYDKISDYTSRDVCPMHMPGHKRNIALLGERLPYGIDITEIDGFDDLHRPEGVLRETAELASALYGSRRSFPLINGSTGGILAAVRASTACGDKIILARNCHKSVYHACELCRLRTAYIVPETDGATGIAGSVTPEQVRAALEDNPGAKLVVITSPTYEGVVSDVRRIAETVHARGIPLLVDEAHGAHLGFSPLFPEEALRCGADMVVTGLHKTLPALTQCALLNVGVGLADCGRLTRQLEVFETSSPSYVLLASIDRCLRLLAENGEGMFSAYAENLARFGEAVKKLKKLKILCHGADSPGDHGSFFAFDPGKIVICAHRAKLHGGEIAALMREKYGIELEMSGADWALAMTSVCDTEKSVMRLADAITDIDASAEEKEAPGEPCGGFRVPEQVMPICESLEHQGRFAGPEEAAGAVSLEYVWAYPPGIPLIAPGERLEAGLLRDMASLTAAGVVLRGTGGKAPRYFFINKDS